MFETEVQNNQPAQQPKNNITPPESSAPTPLPEELISVMPSRFKKGVIIEAQKTVIEQPKAQSKKSLKLILIIAGAVILVIGGGAGFYLWSKSYLRNVPVKKITTPEPINQPPPESPELKLSANLNDPSTNELFSSAELFFPAGALDVGKSVDFVGVAQTAGAPASTYQVLGGVYKVIPELPILKKPVNLRITYVSKLVNPDWEKDVKIGYLKDSIWNTLPSEIDINAKTVSVSLGAIPSDTLALLIEQSKLASKIENIQIAPQIFSSSDKDNDGLTDVEEQIYQTKPDNPDTDGDGQPDGRALINLSDPTRAEGTLAASGLVKVYSNERWLYSFFYPSNWLVKALPETDSSQVMVVTNTGEFFEVSVEDNPEKLLPKDWYLKQSAQVDPTQVLETTIDKQPAAWSPDRLNLYIGKEDQIYIITYNLGTEKEANFKTTFRMMINSFRFTEQSQVPPETLPPGKTQGTRPDGALIKYPDATSVYLLENGKKRPIKSEAVYERLGYTKWDIVEIPLDEWYPTGQILE